MYCMYFYGETAYVGFINDNRFEVVFRFPKKNLLEVMALVNYLNGGDGHVIEKERWDALDARSYSGQK